MALTKIHGWKGEAEVLGGLHQVEFDSGGLIIKGLTLEASYAVLEALASKAIVAVRVEAKASQIEQRVESPPWDPKVEFPEEPKVQAKAQVLPRVSPPPPAKPKVSEAEVAKGLAMEEEKPAPQAPIADNNTVPVEVQNAPNVMSVLDWLIKTRGLAATDPKPIIEAAVQLAPAIGILRRMGAKLPERITSTLQMYIEAGG